MATGPRPAVRWVVPAGLAVLAVGVSLVAPAVASAEPDLPDVTAAELLADLRSEPVEGLSGTVVHRADLGLPALPGITGADGGGMEGSSDPLALLDGEHTVRVWAAAPDRARVSLHGGMGELTLVANGDQAWVWSSQDATVTHYLLPEHEDGTLGHRRPADLPPMTPEEVAELLLERVDPTTEVTVGDPVTVAGRAAYELVLDPRAEGTLVDSVRIAVDAADRVPTRIQVYAVGHDSPALEVGFTELSLVAPDEGVFDFSPPPGATVEEVDLTKPHGPALKEGDIGSPREGGWLDGKGPGPATDGGPEVTVVGDGWASVVVAALPPEALSRLAMPAPAPGEDTPEGPFGGPRHHDRSGAPSPAALLAALPEVSGDWGSGRLLTSRLFSVLLTDDGRVLVGAVDAETLQRAAGSAG